MRLNDDESSTEGLVEGDMDEEGVGGFDLVRSLAQENRPGDFLCGWPGGGTSEEDSLVGVS